MATAKLPDLSTPEHIRFGLTQLLSLFAASVASLLIFGPGWSGLAALGVAALAIFLASEALLRRWAQRQGRLLVTRKEWDDAKQIAQETWTLRLTFGFVFGFIVTGGSLETPTWGARAFGGVVFAAVWVMFPPPQNRPRSGRNEPVSNPGGQDR